MALIGLVPHVCSESLHGKIMDRSSFATTVWGQPVAGVKLVLFDSLGKRIGTKTTSRSGTYRFPKVTPGTYTLALQRKEYSPSPLLRIIALGTEDTVERDFLLDRIPGLGGLTLRSDSKKKKNQLPYYPRLSEGILASSQLPNYFHEARDNKTSLSRFFDAEDTTFAYRQLWLSLIWAEICNHGRPLASLVYLAHALDSTLGVKGIPVPEGMKSYLKVSPDSMEALLKSLHAMILFPSKKNPVANLSKYQVPKSMLVKILEEEMNSKIIPKAKKKAFLVKAKVLLGSTLAGTWAAKLNPRAPALRNEKKVNQPMGPPENDMEFLWKIIQAAAAGKHPNPVALYHLAWHDFEAGQATQSLSHLTRLASIRPEYPQAIYLAAMVQLALHDTAAASQTFDSLTKLESPEWQAKGYQALANIQWQRGEGEKAEATLWHSFGFDTQSAGARRALLLLAEVSLSRDTWNAVEKLLDSLLIKRPREAEARYWLGKMAMKRNQDGVALDHFRQASTLAPLRTEFAVAWAQARFAREEYDAALKILKPIRSKLGGEGLSLFAQCLMFKGRSKEAVQEFERLYAAQPSAQSLVALAQALVAAGQSEKAVATLEASTFRAEFGVKKALAEAKLDLDSPDEALQLVSPLLIEKENDPELHFLAGRCAMKKRDYAKASKEFTSALQYREDYPAVKFQAGLCLLKLGRSGEAHHYFQELTDSDKPTWRAQGWLGQGQAFAKEDKLEAAMENLQRSYQTTPSAQAAAHLATTCMRMDKIGEASRWADKALKLDPLEPLGLMVGVDILFAKHQDENALALAQAGLDKRPGICEIIIVAAKAYLKADRDEQAKRLSLQATKICPEEAAPYYFLGTLAGKNGTTEEARKHFEEYLRSGGDFKRVPLAFR